MAPRDDEHRYATWFGTVQVALRTYAAVAEEVEAATGVAPAQAEVLLTLGARPDGRLRMGELAEALGLTPGGATRLVARMEADGHVARASPGDDRRATYAALTAAGCEVEARVRPARAEAVARHFHGRLDDDELAVLRRVAEKVLDGLGAECGYLRAG